MLNTTSPIPLYHQLADILLTRIRSGDYPAGSRIPSELKLAADYGIGRPTVRQAIELLVQKGYLLRKRGSGTYVMDRKPEVDLFSLDGTTASFQKKGLSTDTVIRRPVSLKDVLDDLENPFNGSRAYGFSRVTRVSGSPVLIEDLFLHPEYFAGIDRIDLKGRSLSEIAEERFYMRPTSGKQTFRIGYPDPLQAEDLEISQTTPILLVKRFLHFAQAENIVYSALFCRTDQYVFSQTIGKNTHG